MYKCPLSEKATIAALNEVQPTNRRPAFTRKMFEAMSRPRNLLKNSQSLTFSEKSRAPHYLTN